MVAVVKKTTATMFVSLRHCSPGSAFRIKMPSYVPDIQSGDVSALLSCLSRKLRLLRSTAKKINSNAFRYAQIAVQADGPLTPRQGLYHLRCTYRVYIGC